MTPVEMQKAAARLDAIRARIAGIAAMLDGALLAKRNRTPRKDGSVRVSPEHYVFQYRGVDGERKWKRVPKRAKTTKREPYEGTSLSRWAKPDARQPILLLCVPCVLCG